MAERWPPPTYVVRVDFRAPMEFVFRWCTDYTAQDAKLEGEEFQRQVLRRSKREVVYEDLYELPKGWRWSRHTVRLRSPNWWHSDSVGSHRELSLDYRLAPLSGGRTRMTLTARRRASGIGPPNPPKREWERDVAASWRSFRRYLERDYRKAAGRARK